MILLEENSIRKAAPARELQSVALSVAKWSLAAFVLALLALIFSTLTGNRLEGP